MSSTRLLIGGAALGFLLGVSPEALPIPLPSDPWLRIPLLLGVFLSVLLLWPRFRRLLIAPSAAVIHVDDLDGPEAASLVWGSEQELYEDKPPGALYGGWGKIYGPVYKFRGVFGARNIVVTDRVALRHILTTQVYDYPKPQGGRAWFRLLLGNGVLAAEGEEHARQRRLLHRAFTPQALRDLLPIFYDCASKTVEQWNAFLDIAGPTGKVIDVQHWATLISLDSIGLAGFSYDFGSLSPSSSASSSQSSLAHVFDTLTDSSGTFAAFVLRALLFVFPAILSVPSKRTKSMRAARERMGVEVGKVWREAVREKEVEGREGGRTVLDLLVRESVAVEGKRVSEEETAAQIMTIIFAGYETTSTALSWALHELALHPTIQSSLRAELASHPDILAFDALHSPSSLPLLSAIVSETLRLYPPILDLHRESLRADVLPTSSGRAVAVPVGTVVTVPLNVLQREEGVWGEDAGEWRPERWLEAEKGEGRKERVLWAFSDGPRVCIGRAFALVEIKAVLATLIREYMFEPAPDVKIEPFVSFVVRPRVVGAGGSALPLMVKRVE